MLTFCCHLLPLTLLSLHAMCVGTRRWRTWQRNLNKKKTDRHWSFYIAVFIVQYLFFHPAAYLRWVLSNIWCVIWRCLRKGANNSKHKERSGDFRCHKDNMATARHPPVRPTAWGPLLLGNDIIILRRWMSEGQRTSPSSSDRPGLLLFLDKVTVRVSRPAQALTISLMERKIYRCYQKVFMEMFDLKPLSRPAGLSYSQTFTAECSFHSFYFWESSSHPAAAARPRSCHANASVTTNKSTSTWL